MGRLPVLFAIWLAFSAMALPAMAVQPDEILSDPRLEQRARDLSTGLRCLVCQNQSIDDSDAPLARDLRLLVRERLKAGESDSQVMDYIVSRYGEFVLLKPRFAAHTLILWFGPLLLLLLGAYAIWRLFSLRREAPTPQSERPLTAAEKRKLSKLLERG